MKVPQILISLCPAPSFASHLQDASLRGPHAFLDSPFRCFPEPCSVTYNEWSRQPRQSLGRARPTRAGNLSCVACSQCRAT